MSFFAKSMFTTKEERDEFRRDFPGDVALIVEGCKITGLDLLSEDEVIDGWARYSFESSATWLNVYHKDGAGYIAGSVLRGIYCQAREVGFREVEGSSGPLAPVRG